ncbi:hypothetical protein BDR07DRAFT_1391865, partial [Suillus spraguei]
MNYSWFENGTFTVSFATSYSSIDTFDSIHTSYRDLISCERGCYKSKDSVTLSSCNTASATPAVRIQRLG